MVGCRVMFVGVGGLVLLCGPVHSVVLGFPGFAPSLFRVLLFSFIFRLVGWVWSSPCVPCMDIP